MLNPFFLQGSGSEQGLIQDLINEHLKIYGVDVYYLPRKYITEKTVIKEVVECEGIGNEDEAIRLLPIWFLTGYTVSLIPVSLAIIIFWGIRYSSIFKL